MPTHVDVLCGDYRQRRASATIARFSQITSTWNAPVRSIFTPFIAATTYHFKIYGAMFLGQRQVALDTADALAAIAAAREIVEPLADWVEGFYPMKQHVLIRFGEWEADKAASACHRTRYFMLSR